MKRMALDQVHRVVPLNAQGIDSISEFISSAMAMLNLDSKEITRMRLAVEDILLMWMTKLENTSCTYHCATRFGRPYLSVSVAGTKLDPGAVDNDAQEGYFYSELLAQSGLAPQYAYIDGENRLTITPIIRRKKNQLVNLLLVMLAAAALGLVCRNLPTAALHVIQEVVSPLYSTMIGILVAISGPLVFVSICSGILGIGSVNDFSKVGKTALTRFLLISFGVTICAALCVTWFFVSGNSLAESGADVVIQIYQMILNIIPDNIVAPFSQGNTMQIISIAICFSMALLILGEKTIYIRKTVTQLGDVVRIIMAFINRYIVVFTFLSVLSFVLSDATEHVGGILKGMLLCIAACVLTPLIYLLVCSLRLRIPFMVLLKKKLPAYLVALSTASSSAALPVCMDTCTKKLGVPEQLVNFVVPIGQVIFKPGYALEYFFLCLTLAETNGIALAPAWIVSAVLVSFLLSVATPAIPGGSLSCFAILLQQLSLPPESIALCITFNIVIDYFLTSCSVSCLQSEMMLCANKLHVLEKSRINEDGNEKQSRKGMRA